MRAIYHFTSYIKGIVEWYRTWGGLPILSWVNAAKYYKRGDYKLSAKYYLKGLSLHSNHPAAYCARLDLSHCYFKLHKFKEAKKVLRDLIKEAPQIKESYVRLARIQLWIGEYMEAVWTMRKAFLQTPRDKEVLSLYINAIVDNNGPGYLLDETEDAIFELSPKALKDEKIRISLARIDMYRDNHTQAKERLARIISGFQAPFDAVLLYAEILLKEGRVSLARQQLRRALKCVPEHPKVLMLLAKSYLKQGPYFNAEFAKQLAINACQSTDWLSPETMHVLAQAYEMTGDKMSALVMAIRAKRVGKRLLSPYSDMKGVDNMINCLSKNIDRRRTIG